MASLTNSVIEFVTPRWVSARHSFSLLLLLLPAIFAGIALTWYWGVAWFFASVILAELLAFAFPSPKSNYGSSEKFVGELGLR
jgi:hypothetical protein